MNKNQIFYFLVILINLFAATDSESQGILSICGLGKELSSFAEDTKFESKFKVKAVSVKAIEYDKIDNWNIDSKEVLDLLNSSELNIYESWRWNLDMPITFVGEVLYEDKRQGKIAIAEHRVCVVDGFGKPWFFEWNNKSRNKT